MSPYTTFRLGNMQKDPSEHTHARKSVCNSQRISQGNKTSLSAETSIFTSYGIFTPFEK